MFVAVIDQSAGTSTSFCSKMVFPRLSVDQRRATLPLHVVIGGRPLG